MAKAHLSQIAVYALTINARTSSPITEAGSKSVWCHVRWQVHALQKLAQRFIVQGFAFVALEYEIVTQKGKRLSFTILVLQGEYFCAPFREWDTMLAVLLSSFRRQFPDSIYQINF